MNFLDLCIIQLFLKQKYSKCFILKGFPQRLEVIYVGIIFPWITFGRSRFSKVLYRFKTKKKPGQIKPQSNVYSCSYTVQHDLFH